MTKEVEFFNHAIMVCSINGTRSAITVSYYIGQVKPPNVMPHLAKQINFLLDPITGLKYSQPDNYMLTWQTSQEKLSLRTEKKLGAKADFDSREIIRFLIVKMSDVLHLD